MNAAHRSIPEICQQFKTDSSKGLSTDQVKVLQKKYGLNEFIVAEHQSWLIIFIKQFQSPLIYCLLFAATIIYFVGPDKYDAFIISGVLLFNAGIGMIQEGKTRKILDALQRYTSSTTLVIRDDKRVLVPDKELVPGDLILIKEGQKVAADARLIGSSIIKVNESSFTGESVPVTKQNIDLAPTTSLFEQTNMLFQGTYVVAGSATAIIVATGAATELGKIHRQVGEIHADIPLRQELDRLSKHIVWGILGLCLFLLGLGLATGKPFSELLGMLTALFICVVPEGLPVVLTLILVSGTYKMVKNNVLIKNLQAVEGLGRIDVIVIDKTGTLTRNEMMVSVVYADNIMWQVTGHGYRADGTVTSQEHGSTVDSSSNVWNIAVASSLLNSAEIVSVDNTNTFSIKGEPTEAALYIFSQKLGLIKSELEKIYKQLYEIPFDPLYRYHAGFYQLDDHLVAFVAGAPELILLRSSADEKAQAVLEQMLANGLRIVAFGIKTFPLQKEGTPTEHARQAEYYKSLIEQDLTFLGFCGIEDAIRPDIHDIITQVHHAGLQVVMATGDHQATALYVAKKTGIYAEHDIVLQGVDLKSMSDEELVEKSRHITVCARVTPDQKIRLVKAFQKKGLLVAMTGDGINDAPSLVAADIGIGMGGIGTEVAKQAADIILLDDSFISIIKAIELGRHIFYTLKRVILYFFATNMGEVYIVLFAMLAGLPLPITVAQILWLNLVTDGFLDIALSTEPQEESLLDPRWGYKKQHLVDLSLWLKTVYMALPMGIGSLLVFLYYYKQDIVLARTMTLFTMAMFQWFNAWSCRSVTRSVFTLGFFSNPWLLAATTLVFLLQLALLYVPFMNRLFNTVPLSASQCIIVIALSSTVLVLEELRKAVVRGYLRTQ